MGTFFFFLDGLMHVVRARGRFVVAAMQLEIREWPLHWRGPKKGTSFFFLHYQYLFCRHQNRNDSAVTIYSAKAKVHLNIKSLASLWGFWFRSVSISDFVLSLWFFQTWEFPFCQAGYNRALKGQSLYVLTDMGVFPIWRSFIGVYIYACKSCAISTFLWLSRLSSGKRYLSQITLAF